MIFMDLFICNSLAEARVQFSSWILQVAAFPSHPNTILNQFIPNFQRVSFETDILSKKKKLNGQLEESENFTVGSIACKNARKVYT